MTLAAGRSEAQDELRAIIGGCTASHGRLFATVASLDVEDVRGPSRLPGWTRGHVLTHLARNADSHVRMLRAARRGEAVEQYPGGREERTGAIEAGAGRPLPALAEDVRRSAAALQKAWAAMAPEAWDGHGLSRGRAWPCRALPYARWREVEIHHVDLGAAYEVTDWPHEYVRRELPLAVATMPERLADGDRRPVLAWLVGRGALPEGLGLAAWESRPAHYFRGIADAPG